MTFLCKDCWLAQDLTRVLARCKVCDLNSGIRRLDPASAIATTRETAAGDRSELVCRLHPTEPVALFCGSCRQPLSSRALLEERSVVAIVGGVGAGKTSLLWVLRARLRSSNGLPIRIRQPLGNTDEQLDQAIAEASAEGRTRATPETDAVIRNYAWELVTTTAPRQTALMAVHDAGGEVWQGLEDLPRDSNPRFYRYLELIGGVIFLIDGEQLLRALDTPSHDQHVVADKAAAQELAILDAMRRRVAASGGEMPVAVAISKADVLWNDERWSAFKPGSGAPRATIEETARALLIAAGRGGMLDELEEAFSPVRYFALSAFGRDMPAGHLSLEDIEPVHVEGPLLSFLISE